MTLRDKVHRFDIRKARDFQATSLNRKIPAMLVRPGVQMSQERMVNWLLRATVYTYGKTSQSSFKDQVAWLHLWPCLVPCLCGNSRTIWDCCWSWGISGPPWAATSATPPKEKLERKWV